MVWHRWFPFGKGGNSVPVLAGNADWFVFGVFWFNPAAIVPAEQELCWTKNCPIPFFLHPSGVRPLSGRTEMAYLKQVIQQWHPAGVQNGWINQGWFNTDEVPPGQGSIQRPSWQEMQQGWRLVFFGFAMLYSSIKLPLSLQDRREFKAQAGKKCRLIGACCYLVQPGCPCPSGIKSV